MIKLAVGPKRGVMTEFASLRESSRHVVHRRQRSLIVLEVAGDAGCAGQVVVIVSVAVRAQPWRHGVRVREHKSCRRVIKLTVSPQHGVVTLFAGLREVCGNMIHRRQRGLIVLQVARHARRAGQVVVIVDVAVRAQPRRHSVRIAQHKPSR